MKLKKEIVLGNIDGQDFAIATGSLSDKFHGLINNKLYFSTSSIRANGGQHRKGHVRKIRCSRGCYQSRCKRDFGKNAKLRLY